MWNIDWTAVGGIATAVASVVAIAAFLAARADSYERTRPVVSAEYRDPKAKSPVLALVVRNVGASLARDVEVSFVPELKMGPGDDRIKEIIIERYSRPIHVLGPGQELSNVFVVDMDDEAKSDLPHELTVNVSYRGRRARRYNDSFRLSLDVVTGETFITSK
jgi:hypothetical protein